jgi:hypothetical protein
LTGVRTRWRAGRLVVAVVAFLAILAPAGAASPPWARPAAWSAPWEAPAGWSAPRAIDQIPPLTQPFTGEASCPSTSLCVLAGTDAVATSTDPGGDPHAWHTALLPGPVRVSLISCPSVRECVGSFGFHWLAVSTDPTGGPGAWRVVRLPARVPQVNDLDCAGERLCVIASGVRVAWSTTPTRGGDAWRSGRVRGATALQFISCPSAALCVASDDSGNLAVSRDPLGGARTWRVVRLGAAYGGVTCPSARLCVGSDQANHLLVSTDPAGGRRAWRLEILFRHGAGDLDTPVCPTVSFCIVDNGGGAVWTSTDPAGGVGTWHRHRADFAAGVIACAGVRACLAEDQDGQIAATADPLRPSHWRRLLRIGGNDLEAVACPSRSLCLAGDDAGNVLRGAGPAGGWRDTAFKRALRHPYGGEEQVLELACATATSCMATVTASDDEGGEGQLYGFDPRRIAATLRPVVLRIPGIRSPELVNRLACPMRRLCEVQDHLASGRTVRLSSRDPIDSASWVVARGGPPPRSACPSPSRCLAPAGHGRLALLARRDGRFQRIRTLKVLFPGPVGQVSCDHGNACVAVGPGGVAVSDDPMAARSWRFAASEPLGLLPWRAACAAPWACVAVGLYGKAVSTAQSPLSRARPSRRRRP